MKAKSILKLLSTAVTTALVASSMVFPALAAGTNYTAVAAQNTSFDKYLLVDKDEKAPAVTFTYTITAGAAIAPTASTLQVYAGVGTPTASVTFAATDTAEDTSLNANYTTYKKTVNVNFSGISFTEPGVYRYIITEDNNVAAGVFYDVDPTDPTDSTKYGDRTRTLDVYVEDDESTDEKDLIVTSYVMYEGTITVAPPSAEEATQGEALTAATAVLAPADPNANVPSGAEKTNRIVNYFKTYSITFGKEVTGNQGSKDKYFKFTLSLTSPVAGIATVDITRADATVSTDVNSATTVSGTNVQTITLSANTAVATDFYLQDGQYIIITGLPEGTKYALTEDAEGYTSTNGITATNSSLDWNGETGNDALSDATSNTTGITANVHTGYTNSKNGIIPTGVLLKATPVIVVGLIVIAGAAFFLVKNVRRKVVEAGEGEDIEE